MDRTHDTDALLQRLSELETALRRPGGISILEERELLAIRRTLSAVHSRSRTATPGQAVRQRA